GRRNTVDGVDVGPGRGLDELPRIRVQRLEIAALAFREQDVECDRALAAAADAGDHGQAVARNRDVDVAQVVLARADDLDCGVGAGGRSRLDSRSYGGVRSGSGRGSRLDSRSYGGVRSGSGRGSRLDRRSYGGVRSGSGRGSRLDSRSYAGGRRPAGRVEPALVLGELAAGVARRRATQLRGRAGRDQAAAAVAAFGT